MTVEHNNCHNKNNDRADDVLNDSVFTHCSQLLVEDGVLHVLNCARGFRDSPGNVSIVPVHYCHLSGSVRKSAIAIPRKGRISRCIHVTHRGRDLVNAAYYESGLSKRLALRYLLAESGQPLIENLEGGISLL